MQIPENLISIPIPPLFSFKECLWFLDRNYDDCLQKIEADSVTKLVRIDDKAILVTITEGENCLVVKVLNTVLTQEKEQKVMAFFNDLFDISRDLTPFYELLHQREDLCFMIDAYHGLRLMGIPNLFEALAWSIIGQQINLSFAYTLKRRLVEAAGKAETYKGIAYYVFSTPGEI